MDLLKQETRAYSNAEGWKYLGHIMLYRKELNIVLGQELSYFSSMEIGKKCYTENEVLSMLEFLMITYLLSSEGTFFNKSSAFPWEQTVLLCRFFLYSYQVAPI